MKVGDIVNIKQTSLFINHSTAGRMPSCGEVVEDLGDGRLLVLFDTRKFSFNDCDLEHVKVIMGMEPSTVFVDDLDSKPTGVSRAVREGLGEVSKV